MASIKLGSASACLCCTHEPVRLSCEVLKSKLDCVHYILVMEKQWKMTKSKDEDIMSFRGKSYNASKWHTLGSQVAKKQPQSQPNCPCKVFHHPLTSKHVSDNRSELSSFNNTDNTAKTCGHCATSAWKWDLKTGLAFLQGHFKHIISALKW